MPALHGRCKPPTVAFQIARPIFTLTIWLIDGLAVDPGTCRASTPVVSIDVIHVNHQTRICHIHGERRIELVLGSDAMQPDGSITGANLSVYRLALRGSAHSSSIEPKCLDQEIVCARDVLICENRDYSLVCRHSGVLSPG